MSFHRAPRVDAIHAEVAGALRGFGRWAVYSLASIGGPVDLLVSDRRVTWLCEIKDGRLPPSARRLTPREVVFLETWPGPASVALSVEEALHHGDLARQGRLTSGIEACAQYLALTGGVGR